MRPGEIRKKYPNQWVLIEFSKLDKNLRVKEGKVIAPASTKEEIYKALLRTRGKNVSVEYCGEMPEDLVVMFASAVHADPCGESSSRKGSCDRFSPVQKLSTSLSIPVLPTRSSRWRCWNLSASVQPRVKNTNESSPEAVTSSLRSYE